MSDDILKKFQDILTNHFAKDQTTDVAKAVDEDKRLFTAVVLVPEQVDAHGDIYSYDVVEKACHDYVEYCMNQNLQHLIDVDKNAVSVVESYIAPSSLTIGEGDVKKGSWVMTVKVHDDAVWDMCKNGEFTGFSVGCSAYGIDLEEDDD